jgi:hypothetical protein
MVSSIAGGHSLFSSSLGTLFGTIIKKEQPIMKKTIFPILKNMIPVFAFFCVCCTDNTQQTTADKKNQQTATANSSSPYDLSNPIQKWELPDELQEISGIVKTDNDHFIAIEDLHPAIYLLKTSDGKATIEKTFSFEQTAKEKVDVEDVAMTPDALYALWSHGVLFRITGWPEKPQVTEIKTALTKENNTEGLAYDPVTGNLLIACKNESGMDDEKKSTRAIYSFDTKTSSLSGDPYLVIHKKEIEEAAGQKVGFYPSGIAEQPITHDLYIISTKGDKCLAIFSHDGKFKSFQFLDRDHLLQPEGICFSSDGKILYISTEGKKNLPPAIFAYKAN